MREIEQALVERRVELAVHSFKDLPTKSPAELTIAAVPARVDPADLLLVRRAALAGGAGDWLPLTRNARVGTASARRRVWLTHFRPDLVIEPLRGNVPTRVRRLTEGGFDAIVLAAAGVERLQAEQRLGNDLAEFVVLRLDPLRFVPAPAQGALAVQCRRDDARVLEALARIDHAPSRAAVTAERDALARAEGGCDVAFGAYCVASGGAARAHGDARTSGRGALDARPRCGSGGARRRGLGQARRGWWCGAMKRLTGKRILITRSVDDCAEWAEQLARHEATPIALPCIETEIIDTPELRAQLAAAVPQSDWLVFTSQRGVEAFATLHPAPIGNARLAAVGPITGEAARKHLGRVDLVGRGGTAAKLAATLLTNRVLEGNPRLLLALAENADDRLERALQKAARCTRLDLYRTIPAPAPAAKRAMSTLGADNVLLASPSAVTGFVNQVDIDIPVSIFTIGPSTSAAARAQGLAVTAEAASPSLKGILEAMQWQN